MVKEIVKTIGDMARSLFRNISLVLFVLALSGCFSIWSGEEEANTATITIYLGGGASRAGFAEDGITNESDISYKLEIESLSGGSIINDVEYIITVGSRKAQAVVTPGFWYIHVEAFYPDPTILYAEGSTAPEGVELRAGQNNVTIHMGRPGGPFTVSFDINPGAGTTPGPVSGQSFLPDATGFPRTGYILSGWNDPGTGNSFSVGSSYTPASDITLYAEWSPITYTVRFNSNLSGASGSMADQSFVYDDAFQALTVNGFTPRNGFAFKTIDFWNTQANGLGDFYNDGDSVSNLSTIEGDIVTLYAQWDFTLDIGDDGPGDGVIFYRTLSGFTCSYDDNTYYFLEAAKTDLGAYRWQVTNTDIQGTSRSIGAGRRNTALILEPGRDNAEAAKIAEEYDGGGMTDWFLPSRDELTQLHNNKGLIGSPSITCWASEQFNISFAHSHSFSSDPGYGSGQSNKQSVTNMVPQVYVWPIRAF